MFLEKARENRIRKRRWAGARDYSRWPHRRSLNARLYERGRARGDAANWRGRFFQPLAQSCVEERREQRTHLTRGGDAYRLRRRCTFVTCRASWTRRLPRRISKLLFPKLGERWRPAHGRRADIRSE